MPRALIIASPTIDLVGGEIRPGGPGLYAGYALASIGYTVFLHGPLGWLTGIVEHVESRLGLHRVGFPAPWSMGAVFRLEETPGGKRATVLSMPPAFDLQAVLDTVAELAPDLVILSPVYGEDCILASTIYAGMLVVDLQGYSRAGLDCPVRGAIVHLSAEDYGFSSIPHCSPRILVYTLGVRGALVVDGCRWFSIPGPENVLEDSTGAGDVYTALFAHYYMATGGDALEAAMKARSLTPLILDDAHRTIGMLSPGLSTGLDGLLQR